MKWSNSVVVRSLAKWFHLFVKCRIASELVGYEEDQTSVECSTNRQRPGGKTASRHPRFEAASERHHLANSGRMEYRVTLAQGLPQIGIL